MSIFRRKNIISNQVIKAKADKLHKRALRDAKKRIKKGELGDSHDLSLYLQMIDDRYTHIKADISNATRVVDYARLRAKTVAETRQLLSFFNQDQEELIRLARIVAQKAREASKTDDLKEEKLSAVDMTKLKKNFEAITGEGNENGRKEQ